MTNLDFSNFLPHRPVLDEDATTSGASDDEYYSGKDDADDTDGMDNTDSASDKDAIDDVNSHQRCW